MHLEQLLVSGSRHDHLIYSKDLQRALTVHERAWLMSQIYQHHQCEAAVTLTVTSLQSSHQRSRPILLHRGDFPL